MIGIIGGSGLSEAIGDMVDRRSGKMHTPYGVMQYTRGVWMGARVVFVPRHGPRHELPPHRVNYKANIWAMNELRVERIVATCAVGTLSERIPPGKITAPEQLLDLTRETRSFFNGRREGVRHVDMTEPFCPVMREAASAVAQELGLEIQMGGTYACLSGPTFETAAEVRMIRMLGGDLVGMTLAPEAKLSRELGICYMPICMPVNWAAGMSAELVSHKQTLERVELMKKDVLNLMRYLLDKLPAERQCPCSRAAMA
ncbi:MAG: MTAP family purine nucleoside phosphorylase [Thermoplasmatota archaeon]